MNGREGAIGEVNIDVMDEEIVRWESERGVKEIRKIGSARFFVNLKIQGKIEMDEHDGGVCIRI